MNRSNPKLSILICGVSSRIINGQLGKLLTKLEKNFKDYVEILYLLDNKRMTIGEKRNKLLNMSSGDYLCFIDDDDDVSESFVDEILKAIEQNADVITFRQHCIVNGKEFEVEFGLGNPNEPLTYNSDGSIKNLRRKPYHMCAWKSAIAKNTPFENISYGEDLMWITKLSQRARSEHHIPKILHYYRYSDNTSESNQYKCGVAAS